MLSFLKRLLSGSSGSSSDAGDMNELVDNEMFTQLIEDLITDAYGDVSIDSEIEESDTEFVYIAEWVDSDDVEHTLTLRDRGLGEYKLRVVADDEVQFDDEVEEDEVMATLTRLWLHDEDESM